MNHDDPGLPEAARDDIRARLLACLDTIGPDQPDPQATGAATLTLLAHVDERYGPDGLFELAAACVRTIAGPGGSMIGEYVGFGRDEINAHPGTPVEYLMGRFGTAITSHDRAQAWQVWQGIAPAANTGEVSAACGEFLTKFIRNAWARHHGGTLQVTLRPGDQWPPVCDFCIGEPATFMWHVTGADINLGNVGTGPVDLRLDDMEFWYACNRCRALIARRDPDWAQVYARHARYRPRASRPDVMTMYKIFHKLRRTILPVPLPATRPTPTPGRR